MATFPRAASPSRQPPGPEDEDPNLDEYDLYSLAHSHLVRSVLLSPGTTCTPRILEEQHHSTHGETGTMTALKLSGVGGRKGRTKREAAANTNRHSPGGHERKLVTKLQNTERKKRGARP
ncbi:nuclear protein 1 isoform X1 [Balaenoptera ricei]|uniref:nuclear protein 1 isoform X1 n=1 Tax=Balaenoptera ricei TaxID=2746895 RepID=UPI0028BEF39B|nr:nuclear protein 1 isoform X1 [Balaenoptera ricei]